MRVSALPCVVPVLAALVLTARAAAIILAKELRLEFRTRELLTATVIFALVVVILFSFAFDPTAAESRRYGPGLLWIAFLFAGSVMLNLSFAREQNIETLDALRMAPISPFAILAGKMLANLIFLAIAEIILVPVFAVLYNISLASVVGRLALVQPQLHEPLRHGVERQPVSPRRLHPHFAERRLDHR